MNTQESTWHWPRGSYWRSLIVAVTFLTGASALGQPWAPGAAQSARETAPPVRVYDYEVVDKLPQSRDYYVQGLQIVDDTLYLSTGQYGESRLLEFEFPTMALRHEHRLPDSLFGEGVTRLGKRLYQLTWRAGKLLVYDSESLQLLNSYSIPTEGWGITHNGSELIYSDGSAQLYFLDPKSLEPQRTLTAVLNGTPLPRLNELEWINGEIWANVFQANQLVRIDPATGFVTAVVDLRGLLPPDEYQEGTDVLNGIAWDARRSALWVTGKRWPWLFQVNLLARTPLPAVNSP